MKNSDILRRVWRDEVVTSKKARLLTLIGRGLGTKTQQTRHRMLGNAPTSDAELFFIFDVLKSLDVNVSFYEDTIMRKRARYLGQEYATVELSD